MDTTSNCITMTTVLVIVSLLQAWIAACMRALTCISMLKCSCSTDQHVEGNPVGISNNTAQGIIDSYHCMQNHAVGPKPWKHCFEVWGQY